MLQVVEPGVLLQPSLENVISPKAPNSVLEGKTMGADLFLYLQATHVLNIVSVVA